MTGSQRHAPAVREVVYAEEAERDLLDLFDYILERSGSRRALEFTEDIAAYCERLADFPERGLRRDDLWQGLRVTGFRRRVAIAFHVSAERVVIDRILYGGRDIEGIFSPERD
jgi:toxin ParE1/3/4